MKGIREEKPDGALVVAMGIPGCGKSSVFRALHERHKIPAFFEPEEKDWSDAVHKREVCGRFTGLMWFRSQRVPQLFDAHALRQSGQTVLVDSYYDKLIAHYIGKPGMEWLIAPDDPYYDLAVATAQKDLALLPDADAIVFFHVDYETWLNFLRRRDRDLDRHPGFLESFPTQDSIFKAARRYCQDTGASLIEHHQRVSSVGNAAEKVGALLTEAGFEL